MVKRVSKNRMHELLDALVEMIFMEIEFCRKEDIPMAAADKTVILSLLKNNDITANVDDAGLDKLKEEFSNVQNEAIQKQGRAIIEEAQANYMS